MSSHSSQVLQAFDHPTFALKNRTVMAPVTRSRATADHIPTDLMFTYYGQRAGAGLIITEGTAPSPNGVGYARIPGIYNEAQAAAWKKVTDAVHEKGGKIFIQLMHTGRVSHPNNMPEGAVILAPSAIAPVNTQMYTDQAGAPEEIPSPKEMDHQDIQHAIQEFVQAAQYAVGAGFDGVELHAANGYLLEQFFNPSANQRTDEYGGSIENRARFILEVAQAVTAAIGKERVGIRLSPNGAFNDILPFEEQKEAYTQLAHSLNELGLVYIHLVNHAAMGAPALPDDIRDAIRANFKGVLILSGGYNQETANADLEAGLGDLVAFGRPFISNPDLVDRFAQGAELANPDFNTFYTPGEKGYTDYPVLTTA
ncbi:MAG: alkene reductase [Bacteroidota bacterium]